MGQTKKEYEKAINDFIAHLYSHADGDDDYQYEMYKEKQMEAEREAYEQHFQDKFING